jgi:hypothetical protein
MYTEDNITNLYYFDKVYWLQFWIYLCANVDNKQPKELIIDILCGNCNVCIKI